LVTLILFWLIDLLALKECKLRHFRINPDPDVSRIAQKMYRIHSLVGVSHFAQYGIVKIGR